jgi:formamidopyrimidine-DNA glycosylase
MPEGHTVHRIASLFNTMFAGRTVEACSPQGRFRDGANVLDGTTLRSSYARGKHLFGVFDHDRILRVHLGIYGAWDVLSAGGAHQRAGAPGLAVVTSLGAPRVARRPKTPGDASVFPPEPVGQVRLRLTDHRFVADLRGPTACEVLTPEEAEAIERRLGPDPQVDDREQGREEFIRRMKKTATPVARALMNQHIVSGIGNVYRAEILFRHRLDPYAPSKQLTDDTLAALWEDWAVLLHEGVATGVMMTRDDLDEEGRDIALRKKDHRHFVYGRAGLPCRVCGGEVQRTLEAARKLYFCPGCQQGVV